MCRREMQSMCHVNEEMKKKNIFLSTFTNIQKILSIQNAFALPVLVGVAKNVAIVFECVCKSKLIDSFLLLALPRKYRIIWFE